VRPFEIEDNNGNKRIVFYEVDAEGNIKRDSNNNPITGKPYGNTIRIQTGDGATLTYAHMAHSDSAPVRVGDYAPIGSPIGTVGNTGNSYGNHLHFEVRNSSNPVTNYLPA
jgi:murein DD-endopeptidase MepM/ murein hydrolase activator NlpD